MTRFVPQGMGWLPDLPDPRDYTFRHGRVLPLLARLIRTEGLELPPRVDLRRDEHGEYFTPPEDQGPLNCSCAFAVLSLAEYFERRGRGRTFEGSKRFLYKVTRNRIQTQLRATGDTGADLRTTLKEFVQAGVPKEVHWPYIVHQFDEEPGAFPYRQARPFPGLRYLRLDEANRSGKKTLKIVKSFLAAGFPVAFGFPVPSSLTKESDIPYRHGLDSYRGGQAAVAVGYDDNRAGPDKTGALLIRCSWGSEWGDHGYGWLPFAYVRNQLARDFWTFVNEDWLDATEFSRPATIYSVETKLENGSH